jgi:hypothetical protein
MNRPTRKKDVMKLTGMMAALGCLISKLEEKGLPFFKLLKKSNKFQGTDEADLALEELKTFLTSEGTIRQTREGGSKWELIKILLKGDGNSNKMNTASNTRLRHTIHVGQAHVATGVPLDLGINTTF